MRRSIFFLVLFMLWPFHSFAEVYIWTDEKGVKHYSDELPEEAQKVERRDEIEHDEGYYHKPETIVEDRELELDRRRRKKESAVKKKEWEREKAKREAQTEREQRSKQREIEYTKKRIKVLEKSYERYLGHGLNKKSYEVKKELAEMKRKLYYLEH
jgi:hypothetical protein